MQLKEKEKQLVRTHAEAINYQAKYHLAESKRWAAASHIHELGFAMSDKALKKKAGKADSEERRRIKDHLVQKDNEVRSSIDCMRIPKISSLIHLG